MTKSWVVTLIHDQGMVDVRVTGKTIKEAIQAACDIENAPVEAVYSVCLEETISSK